jgi:hypothetical protein
MKNTTDTTTRTSATIQTELAALETRRGQIAAETETAQNKAAETRAAIIAGKSQPAAIIAAQSAVDGLQSVLNEIDEILNAHRDEAAQVEAAETRAAALVELNRLKAELNNENRRLNELGLDGVRRLIAMLNEFEIGIQSTRDIAIDIGHIAQKIQLAPHEQQGGGSGSAWGLGYLDAYLAENGVEVLAHRAFVEAARLYFDVKQTIARNELSVW